MSVPAIDAPGAPACLLEIAGQTFAVSIGHAREAREFSELTRVPLAPAPLIGMANLRGAIVPVVDLWRVLSLGARPRARTIRTLIVEATGTRAALALDRVIGVESLHEAPGARRDDAAGFEGGRFLRGDDTVPILDVAKIVQLLGRWTS